MFICIGTFLFPSWEDRSHVYMYRYISISIVGGQESCLYVSVHFYLHRGRTGVMFICIGTFLSPSWENRSHVYMYRYISISIVGEQESCLYVSVHFYLHRGRTGVMFICIGTFLSPSWEDRSHVYMYRYISISIVGGQESCLYVSVHFYLHRGRTGVMFICIGTFLSPSWEDRSHVYMYRYISISIVGGQESCLYVSVHFYLHRGRTGVMFICIGTFLSPSWEDRSHVYMYRYISISIVGGQESCLYVSVHFYLHRGRTGVMFICIGTFLSPSWEDRSHVYMYRYISISIVGGQESCLYVSVHFYLHRGRTGVMFICIGTFLSPSWEDRSHVYMYRYISISIVGGQESCLYVSVHFYLHRGRTGVMFICIGTFLSPSWEDRSHVYMYRYISISIVGEQESCLYVSVHFYFHRGRTGVMFICIGTFLSPSWEDRSHVYMYRYISISIVGGQESCLYVSVHFYLHRGRTGVMFICIGTFLSPSWEDRSHVYTLSLYIFLLKVIVLYLFYFYTVVTTLNW